MVFQFCFHDKYHQLPWHYSYLHCTYFPNIFNITNSHIVNSHIVIVYSFPKNRVVRGWSMNASLWDQVQSSRWTVSSLLQCSYGGVGYHIITIMRLLLWHDQFHKINWHWYQNNHCKLLYEMLVEFIHNNPIKFT